MPSYEVSLILKSLDKATLSSVLQRYSKVVLANGGLVRAVENAGTRMLPYQMKSRREVYDAGRYAFLKVDLAPHAVSALTNALSLEEEIIRHNIVKLSEVPGETRTPKFDKCKRQTSASRAQLRQSRLDAEAAAEAALPDVGVAGAFADPAL